MSSRSTNTMSEFLQRMLGDISQAKSLPDADLGFLIQMETGILQKLRAPIDALAGQMQGDGGQAAQTGMLDPSQGGQGGMPQGMPGEGMMGGAGPGGGVPSLPQRVTGTRMEANIPGDELRRMLANQ